MKTATNKFGLDDPLDSHTHNEEPQMQQNSETTNPPSMDMQENMQNLRGGLNVTNKKDQSNRNIHDVKDPTQLGGSRYEQHKTKGEKGDISQSSLEYHQVI